MMSRSRYHNSKVEMNPTSTESTSTSLPQQQTLNYGQDQEKRQPEPPTMPRDHPEQKKVGNGLAFNNEVAERGSSPKEVSIMLNRVKGSCHLGAGKLEREA